MYGPPFQAVQEKQITIPLIVPYGLEDFLIRKLREDYPDLPVTSIPLIPLHDATNYDATASILPSLRDSMTEEGNLRYWVITNTSMWAGQHRVLDEMTEILWSLHSLFKALQMASPGETFDSFGPRYLQNWYKHRYPETLDEGRRDLLLFRKWVLPTPLPTFVEYYNSNGRDIISFHPLFDEKVIKYPFPNELFWNAGEEGEWDRGEGVPEWRTVPINHGRRNTPAEEFYDPNGSRPGSPSPMYRDDIWKSPFYRGRVSVTH